MSDNKSHSQKLRKNEKKTGITIKISVPIEAGSMNNFRELSLFSFFIANLFTMLIIAN